MMHSSLPTEHIAGDIPLRIVLWNIIHWVYGSFILAPTATLICLYGFSWRVATAIGYWPRAWIDDPKFIGPVDWLTSGLYFLIIPLLMWSLTGVAAVPVLTVLLRRQRTWFFLLLGLICFALSLWLLTADPYDRLRWYMD